MNIVAVAKPWNAPLKLLLLVMALCVSASAAQAQYSGSGLFGLRGSPGLYGRPGSTEPYPFHFNNLRTTYFGPAYADILLQAENFLACRPPIGRNFSYALCFYSGPAVSTPVAAPGATPVNPPLPCTLSSDGLSANCTCYALTTDQYPPPVPYFIDINAILNLDLYLSTIATCGRDGANCDPHNYKAWNKAPACQAANLNWIIPTAQLVSVFSPVMASNYTSGSTSCSKGAYAACMTAPCYHTGKYDNAGNELVQCKCPVYEGPFEIGQPDMPCDANALTPSGGSSAPKYVWSASHNPKLNHPDPPATGCLPDMGGGKGCPLYQAGVTYPVAQGSSLFKQVCASYKKDIRKSSSTAPGKGVQIPYSCDAALCTTLGIGQTAPLPPPDPVKKASILQNACNGLSSQPGLQAILALEAIDQCSCCASQVCGCANPGVDINADTQAAIATLNADQESVQIVPQCQINGTLCGAQGP